MEKIIICKIFIWDLHQRIDIFDPVTNQTKCAAITRLGEIPEMICGISNKEQINNIHLFGEQKYAEGVKEDILAFNAKNYSQNKINVEVN